MPNILPPPDIWNPIGSNRCKMKLAKKIGKPVVSMLKEKQKTMKTREKIYRKTMKAKEKIHRKAIKARKKKVVRLPYIPSAAITGIAG